MHLADAAMEPPLFDDDFGSANENPLPLPEPMLFDLVRPLGARQGEFEINTLAMFPFSASGVGPGDPFGIAPTSPDRGGIEWAPEVEYAIVDNFAVEFELPFEDLVLEAYKGAVQWTFGTAFDDQYIHGTQIIVEPTVRFRNWNTTFLYLAGVRFDDTWSALVMAGFRLNLEGPNTADTFERLLNASLFAEINEHLILGVETNTAIHVGGDTEFIVLPQFHLDITNTLQLQSGLGFGFANQRSESSFVMRAIYER